MKSDRTTGQHPPRLSEWLIRQFTWREDRESLVDNFLEEYEHLLSTRGKIPARWWYRVHALRSVVPCIRFETKWSLIMLKNYLKIAWRTIQRHKAYSFINIFGLAVGMAVCTLIFLWVKDELHYDRFHQHSDRLYRVVMEVQGVWWTGAPQPAITLSRWWPIQLSMVWLVRAAGDWHPPKRRQTANNAVLTTVVIGLEVIWTSDQPGKDLASCREGPCQMASRIAQISRCWWDAQ